MFYIRADANMNVGMGHVMRCMAIAEAAVQNGYKPVFITADNDGEKLITERGFSVITLNTDYKEMGREIPQLENIVKSGDIILVDSYYADAGYYTELGKICRTACIEDMGTAYPVDLLINYNIYASDLGENYKKENAPERVLLGAEYVPLRKVYSDSAGCQVKEQITNVIITTGGSDPYFAAGTVLEAVLNDKKLSEYDITYHVVSGPFNIFADRLKREYSSRGNVIIYEGLNDLKPLIEQCDVAICAAGSTIYEICATGVPMICFYFVQNQKQGALALERLTDIKNAGCFTDNKAQVAENIVSALQKCAEDKAYREKLCRQERSIVDGGGAARIAKAVCGLK